MVLLVKLSIADLAQVRFGLHLGLASERPKRNCEFTPRDCELDKNCSVGSETVQFATPSVYRARRGLLNNGGCASTGLPAVLDRQQVISQN
jgi:hypothetical protein